MHDGMGAERAATTGGVLMLLCARTIESAKSFAASRAWPSAGTSAKAEASATSAAAPAYVGKLGRVGASAYASTSEMRRENAPGAAAAVVGRGPFAGLAGRGLRAPSGLPGGRPAGMAVGLPRWREGDHVRADMARGAPAGS